MSTISRLAVIGVLLALVAAQVGGCVAVPTEEDTRLKIALIPVLDVIPIFIAEENGYFAEQGIQVEGVPVKSALERDVLIQTGQVDGMLTDLISNGVLNKNKVQVKAVYTSRRPYPGAPVFRILASPGTDIVTPADLKGIPIGVSQNTVIEYLTERMLAAEGLKPEEIVVQEVSAIPVRFEQLLNGNIRAATLPDPLAQGAIAAGARLIVDDSKYADLSQSVLTFRIETLTARPNTIRKFLAAWEKAVRELNANSDRYQGVLIEQGRVPESIQDSYKMPPFPERGVPSEAEIADIVAWLQEKGLVSRNIPYDEMVDEAFLPK